MKMNTLIKYQLKDMRYVFLVLYIIIILTNLSSGSFAVVNGEETSSSGTEISSAITFFIVAMCCFTETFHMWIQNGITRKNIFKGFFFGTLCIAAVCTVLNCILVFGTSLLLNSRGYFTFLSYIFEEFFTNCSFIIEFLINVLFIFLLGVTTIMAGYFIAILFYKAGKYMRVGIAAGLPIFFFGIVPILYSSFANTVVVEKLTSVLLFILGIESGNPFYLMTTLTAALILLSTANYFMIHKLQVKTHS